MVVYFDSISDKNLSEIEKELEPFSERELYAFANKLLENPYKDEILLILLRKLFNDKIEFIELFCRFLEDAYPSYIDKSRTEIIESQVAERVEVAFGFVKFMVNMGSERGVAAGSLLFMIYDKMEEADNFLIQGFKSENENYQRCSLVSLLLIIRNEAPNIEKYLDILKNVASNISHENENRLIFCLQQAFNKKPEMFQQLLESEIERRGASAACRYITIKRTSSENSILILKKAIEILESTGYNEMYIDMGLAEVYLLDPAFVVKRIKDRLHERKRVKLMNDFLEGKIKKAGNDPIIELIESEIDSHNLTLESIGESILKDLFSSHEEWISWCEKWKEDPNKETIILKSSGIVLTEFVNYKHDGLRNHVISLVKYFAKNKNLDYEKETKGINLGADKTEGYKNKESAIKALYILDKILNPTIKIEIEDLKTNLKNAPCLCEAFGYSWLIKNAKTNNPHVVNYIFCQNSPISQSHLENIFSILEKHNIAIKKGKLRDVDNDKNILAEVEVISRLAPYFEITPEPDIEELKPKKLDLMIEYDGEKALIEIATVEDRLELKLAHGAQTFIPGGKVKKVLLEKFKNQLYEGKVDVRIPVIILLNLQVFNNDYEVLNGVYGEFQFSWMKREDTHEVVAEGNTRDNNGFYERENTEIVTAIGAYKVDTYREDKFVGKLHRPFKSPINKMSPSFRLRLRNALFGNSETSNWKTLMKIPGIDENLAKLLYFNGIEDIGTLATINEREILIEDIQWEEISKFKSESIRIIHALSTNSIKYLNKIDLNDIKIFQNEGIYLIHQLLEREEVPEGINELKWSLLVEDAKRIVQ